MEQQANTFDLTQPPVINKPAPAKNEVKTVTVTMNPKKEEPKKVAAPVAATSNKLPPLSMQPQTTNKNSKSQTSKSVPKLSKIEVIRTVMEQAASQQQSQNQNKKEKKVKLQQGSTQVLKELYQKRVAEQYNQVYKDQDNQAHILYELGNLEKKRNILNQLKNKDEILFEEKEQHDQLVYEIKTSTQQIKQLDQQLADLGLIFAKEEDISNLEASKAELAQLEASLAQANHETSILTYMYEQRRKLLLFVQKQCTECYDELKVQNQKLGVNMNSTSYRQKTIESLSKVVEKFRNDQIGNTGNQLWASVWKSDFDPFLQNMLSDQISYFEDKKAFNEVVNHQKLIEEQKLRDQEEMQRLEQLKAKQEKEKANEKIRQDKKKIENLLNDKKKLFEKLRKVTRVSELDKIIPHKNDLDLGNVKLKQIEEDLMKQMEEYQIEIEKLKEQIKNLKYMTGSDTEINQLKIDNLERVLMKVFDEVQVKEKQVKRIEKSIDEVTVAMSRIMYQLQGKGTKLKNIEISRDKLISTASVVSLRLERMLTVLSKRKEFLNEESVNTNPKYIEAPEFVGINTRKYAEMEGKDFIENDIFVYKEEDSLDEEEQFIEVERTSTKKLKEELEKERLLLLQKAKDGKGKK